MNDEAFEVLTNLAEDSETDETKPVGCEHRNTITERAQDKVCEDCGQILSKNFTYEREWRYYGTNDTKHMNDPNRCSIRKQDERGIFRDLEKFKINKKIAIKVLRILFRSIHLFEFGHISFIFLLNLFL